jgi:hypothetical protein
MSSEIDQIIEAWADLPAWAETILHDTGRVRVPLPTDAPVIITARDLQTMTEEDLKVSATAHAVEFERHTTAYRGLRAYRVTGRLRGVSATVAEGLT